MTTAVAPDGGETQQVLFVPGEFRPDPNNPGVGTQRLFTSADGVVLYADPGEDDSVPPTIAESHGAIIGGTVAFSVDTDATAQRVVVLFRELSSSDWRSVDLVRSPGTDHWTGGATVSTQLVEFGVQAADQAGNVAYSFNKTDNFLAVPPAGGTLAITLSAAQPPTAGWFTTPPVTATISGTPAGATVKYSLDGAAFTTYTGPFPVTGEGIHFIVAADDANNLGATVVPIDMLGPNASATVSAFGAVDGWSPGAATVNITAIDPGGSGVARIVWSASGAQNTPPTNVNGESAQLTISANGTTTVTFHAVDSAGNVGPSGNVTVKVDSSGPTVQCGTADGLWHATDVSIACTASDAGVGLADPLDDASFNLSTTVAAGTETANAPTGTRNVCDRLAQCTVAGPIAGNKVDKKAPTITITAPVAGSYSIGQVVNAAFTCTDGGSPRRVVHRQHPERVGDSDDTRHAHVHGECDGQRRKHLVDGDSDIHGRVPDLPAVQPEPGEEHRQRVPDRATALRRGG